LSHNSSDIMAGERGNSHYPQNASLLENVLLVRKFSSKNVKLGTGSAPTLGKFRGKLEIHPYLLPNFGQCRGNIEILNTHNSSVGKSQLSVGLGKFQLRTFVSPNFLTHDADALQYYKHNVHTWINVRYFVTHTWHTEDMM